MKKKIKKILKNRIFLCLLTAIIVGTVSVSAATYFPSNDVTYDNKESGLASTNVQGAIDELYNVCIPSTSGNYILKKIPILSMEDGLYKDKYEEGRYFYKGGNPNNYITFNGEKAGWRILSIEPDKTIKIIRTISLGDREWNSRTNDWTQATLNTYLNETYYNSLNSDAQNQIVSHEFSIGSTTKNGININNENSKKWTGKIALPTVSEYFRTNLDIFQCETYDYNEYRDCIDTTWMVPTNGTVMWFLSPVRNSTTVNILGYDGSMDGNNSYNTRGVRPTLYLSSEIKITGGTGTSQDPYQISL